MENYFVADSVKQNYGN